MSLPAFSLHLFPVFCVWLSPVSPMPFACGPDYEASLSLVLRNMPHILSVCEERELGVWLQLPLYHRAVSHFPAVLPLAFIVSVLSPLHPHTRNCLDSASYCFNHPCAQCSAFSMSPTLPIVYLRKTCHLPTCLVGRCLILLSLCVYYTFVCFKSLLLL